MKKKLIELPFTNVFLFSLFWAIEIFVSKLAFKAGAHPATFVLQTLFITFILLAIFILPKKWTEIRNLKRSTLKKIIVANSIHSGFGTFFVYSGIALTTTINAGFLVKFSLVTTLIIAWIILKEKMTTSKAIAAFMMLIGTFFLTTKGELITPNSGDLLILLACVSWSTGNVLVRQILKNNPISGETIALLSPISGIPLIIAFSLLSPLYPNKLQNVFQINFFSLDYFGYVLITGILAGTVTILLKRTLKVASASYMTMMSMITPIIVTFLALAFLKEQMALFQIIGALLIILASIATHYLKIEKH